MKHLRQILMTAALLITPLAIQAQEDFAYTSFNTNDASNSEYFHQTNQAHFELTPALRLQFLDIDYRGTTFSSADQRVILLQVTGEYGINETFSAGATLGYLSAGTNFSPASTAIGDAVGWVDHELFVKGRIRFLAGMLRFGSTFALSNDKIRVGSNQNTNAYSGGHTITPYIGFDMPFFAGSAGVRVTYDAYKTDQYGERTLNGGRTADFKDKGGQQMTASAFYEMPIEEYLLGFALTYSAVNKTKTETLDTTIYNSNETASTALRVYGVANLAPNLTLLPELQIGAEKSPTQIGRSYVDYVTGWGMGVAGRFLF